MLLCLGLDYKRGGFVDRALEAFNEVLRLDPKNEYALLNLQKLHEEQHQWTEAYDTRQRLVEARRRSTRGRRARRFSRSSRTRSASRRCAGRTTPRRSRRFEAAIDLDARAVPAYLNLGDVRVAAGQRARSGGDLGDADRRRARPRLSRVRSARGAGDPHRQRRSGSRACAAG